MISRNSGPYQTLRVARNRFTIFSRRLHHVDSTAYIHWTSRVARDIVAEPYVFVGRRCTIAPRVIIRKYAMLASNIAIVGDDHNWREPGVPIQFAGRPNQRTTIIGADAWLGHGAIILRGATIGDGAIVAAGAVVTRDVPAYEIWAGTPATKLGDRFAHEAERAKHDLMLATSVIQPSFADPLHVYPPVKSTQE